MKEFVSLRTFQLRILSKRLICQYNIQVGSADELFSFSKPMYGIVNTHGSSLPGEHWLALVWEKNTNKLEVFDSFGFLPELYGAFIERFAKIHRLKLRHSIDQYQKPDSVMFGYYSLHFLKLSATGFKYHEILKRFSVQNVKQNDFIVKQMFRKVKFPYVKDCTDYCIKLCQMKSNDFSSVCIQRNKKCIKL